LFEFIPENFVKIRQIIAFTLAEVLITLLVIGVVASLVVPALINETQKAEYVTKLKKESAILQQAFKLLVLDAGGSILNNPNFNCSISSTYCKSNASANAMNDFASKLNLTKNCGNDMGCFHNSFRKFLGNGYGNSHLDFDMNMYYGKAILADGTMMYVSINNSGCNINCGDIMIDINGTSGPNTIGRDMFYFMIKKTGLYPEGANNDGFSCDINSSTWSTSAGCTAKVLKEGAMNY